MGEEGGRLVLVATPIGNLGDVSRRAVESLAAADVIACEDTRRARKLLTAAGVTGKRLVAVHAHNEAARVGDILELLRSGRCVAVVSDAGMPGIADPGERLVAAASAAGHDVVVVPGPSAALTALVGSGLPTGRFVFEGFLPRAGAERRRRLAALAGEPRTIVLYEAPHRLAKTLADLLAVCGEGRRVGVSRELTKVHEEVWRGTLGAAVARAESGAPRGEHVIVVDGAPPAAAADDAEIEAALDVHLAAGADRRSAVAAVAADLGVGKRRVYELALGRGRHPLDVDDALGRG